MMSSFLSSSGGNQNCGVKETAFSNKKILQQVQTDANTLNRTSIRSRKMSEQRSHKKLIDTGSASQSKVRLLMIHKEELERVHSQDKAKSKAEIVEMRQRMYELENTICRLEKEKIQNEEEIAHLLSKLRGHEETIESLSKTEAERSKKEDEHAFPHHQATQLQITNQRLTLTIKSLQCKLEGLQKKNEELSSKKASVSIVQVSPINQCQQWLQQQIEAIRLRWDADNRKHEQQIKQLQENQLWRIGQMQKKLQAQVHLNSQRERKMKEMEEQRKQERESGRMRERACEQQEMHAKRLEILLQSQQANYDQQISNLKKSREQWESKSKTTLESCHKKEQEIRELSKKLASEENAVLRLTALNQQNCEKWIKQQKQLSLTKHEREAEVQQLKAAVAVEISKQAELEKFVDCLKQKYAKDMQNLRSQYNQLSSLMEIKHREISQMENQIERNVEVIGKLQGELSECCDRQRVCQQERQLLKSEVQGLEIEAVKWKEYRQQFMAQFQSHRRQNKKLKRELLQREQELARLTKLQSEQFQAEKAEAGERVQKLLIGHQKQKQELMNEYESKIEQMRHCLREEIRSEALGEKAEQIKHLTNNVMKLQQLLQDSEKANQLYRKQISTKEEELKTVLEDNEEVKKREKDLNDKMKKVMELRESECGWKVNNALEKVSRLQEINQMQGKSIAELQQLVKTAEQDKWNLQSRQMDLQRNIVKLQSQKAHAYSQAEHLSSALSVKNEELNILISAKRSLEQKYSQSVQTIHINQSEIVELTRQMKSLASQNKSLSLKLVDAANECKQASHRARQTEGKENAVREKEREGRKMREQIYNKITSLPGEYFDFKYKSEEGEKEETEFLQMLYTKFRILVQHITKLKEELQANKENNHRQIEEQNWIQERYKNRIESNLQETKESYEAVHRKYLRYKEAYLSCKGKLERQRLLVINDQRFTEQILSHCKTLATIQKIL